MHLPDDAVARVPERQRSRGPSAALLHGMRWTTLDQALSSCTNFGVTVFAARELGQRNFGAFGLAFSVAVVLIGVIRSLVTEPLLSRPELAAGEGRAATFGAVTCAVMVLGILAAIITAVAGAVLGEVSGQPLIALAAVLPGVCVQDAWRYCFISENRPGAAVVNDAIWLMAVLGTMSVMVTLDGVSPAMIVLAWGGTGAVAGVLGFVQAGIFLNLRASFAWLQSQSALGVRYCAEYLSASASSQFALVALGAIAGLNALGAVRAAQALFGPLVILFSGTFLAAVPMATRVRTEPEKLRETTVVIAGGMSAFAVTWMLVGLALPSPVGRQLFGDTWASMRTLILPVGLSFVAGGVASGPIVGLRALAAARQSLRARLAGLPFLFGVPLLGGMFSGAVGFSFGLALGTLCGAVLFWWQFIRTTARSRTLL